MHTHTHIHTYTHNSYTHTTHIHIHSSHNLSRSKRITQGLDVGVDVGDYVQPVDEEYVNTHPEVSTVHAQFLHMSICLYAYTSYLSFLSPPPTITTTTHLIG